MIWDYMLHGMACAAWVVGLVLVLGVCAGLMYLFCLAMQIAFGGQEETEGKYDKNKQARA